MNIFKIVKGQEQAAELLTGSLLKNRLSHAYLFAGPSGVGRLTASLELAASWMCSVEGPGYCGTCHDCIRILRFQHPDVMLTIPCTASTTPEEIGSLLEARAGDRITPLRFPGNISIRIAQIREMESRLSKKSFENKGHFEIILDADRMREEAANALLKTLEEPPENTIIVLLSSSWSSLLPTVRSRTHHIRFRRLSKDLIADIIAVRTGLPLSEALEIAAASDGRPGQALLKTLESSPVLSEEDPASILRGIVDSSSASNVISMAAGFARKSGRDGALEFSVGMQSYVHDLRRRTLGMDSLSHSTAYLDGIEINDEAGENLVGIFQTAQTRLRGNGMARIVLTAAFLSAWKILRASGEDTAV